jgi:hypothetical protein
VRPSLAPVEVPHHVTTAVAPVEDAPSAEGPCPRRGAARLAGPAEVHLRERSRPPRWRATPPRSCGRSRATRADSPTSC